jgi:hypothetical protein
MLKYFDIIFKFKFHLIYYKRKNVFKRFFIHLIYIFLRHEITYFFHFYVVWGVLFITFVIRSDDIWVWILQMSHLIIFSLIFFSQKTLGKKFLWYIEDITNYFVSKY